MAGIDMGLHNLNMAPMSTPHPQAADRDAEFWQPCAAPMSTPHPQAADQLVARSMQLPRFNPRR